ncbi:hypothetical protein [Streptomyces sp. NPDC000229]|uniref:hypothetical protein n=1 Tax=Streptomyces sp. NPDC000229 TaxID=3154247 RepID=UPI003318ED91
MPSPCSQGSPWLGHDTAPGVEHLGASARLTPGPVEIPVAVLPDLLADILGKLTGFLTAVERWADRCAPSLAADLVARLARDLDIGAPLPRA